ncbi:hypothetical protein Bca4012_065689 [Brassica carinata]
MEFVDGRERRRRGRVVTTTTTIARHHDHHRHLSHPPSLIPTTIASLLLSDTIVSPHSSCLSPLRTSAKKNGLREEQKNMVSNVSSYEVVRSLLYNNNNDSLFTVQGQPDARFAFFESESLNLCVLQKFMRNEYAKTISQRLQGILDEGGGGIRSLWKVEETDEPSGRSKRNKKA